MDIKDFSRQLINLIEENERLKEELGRRCTIEISPQQQNRITDLMMFGHFNQREQRSCMGQILMMTRFSYEGVLYLPPDGSIPIKCQECGEIMLITPEGEITQ